MAERFLDAGPPGAATVAVVLGAPEATAYPGRTAHATGGPAALRAASRRLVPFVGNHDFDSDTVFAAWHARLADGGDVPTRAGDAVGNRERIASAVSDILARPALPIVLGGDDSVAEPFLAAWRGSGPVTVVQVDAHLDFRDEVEGEQHGYSSPMRRASEMAWVRRVIHVGQRGVGSARPADVEDSLAAGNTIITARELRRAGVEAIAAGLDPDEPYVIVYDVDGTDPADIGAVRAPVAGGPGAALVGDLFAALAARGTFGGMVVTEFEPELDAAGTAALALVRVICRALGAALREQPASSVSRP
jgi:agmatinase